MLCHRISPQTVVPTTGSLNVNPLNNANFFIILKIHESLFRLNKILTDIDSKYVCFLA